MGSHILPSLTDDPLDLDHPWWMRSLRHIADITISSYSAAVGGVVLAKAIDGGHYLSPPLQHMPVALAGTVAAFVMLGGIIALIGGLMRIENLKLELGIETAGWFIMFAGWGAYILAAYGYSEVTGRVAATIIIALGCLLKVVALIIHQRILRRRQPLGEKVIRLIERVEGRDV